MVGGLGFWASSQSHTYPQPIFWADGLKGLGFKGLRVFMCLRVQWVRTIRFEFQVFGFFGGRGGGDP